MRNPIYPLAALITLVATGCGIHYANRNNENSQPASAQVQTSTMNSLDSLLFFSDASSNSSRTQGLDALATPDSNVIPRVKSATDYPISSSYGKWRKVTDPRTGFVREGPHLAIDYAAPKGEVVLADANLPVKEVGYDRKLKGNYVILGNEEIEFHYYHLSRYSVEKGQIVKQNQEIGKVGNTGFSTGPHMHRGARLKNKEGEWTWVNPNFH